MDCSVEIIEKTIHSPFRNPFRLTVTLASSLQAVPFSSLFRRFAGIRELRLRGQTLHSSEIVDVSDVLPQLITLDIEVEEIHPEFPITNLLTPTLEDLYLRHNAPIERIDLTNEIVLPNLRVFGATSPDYLLDMLRVPQLETMLWYGSSFPIGNHAKEVVAKDAYMGLKRLELEDWTRTDAHYNAVSIFVQIASHSPSLKSLKFTRTYVDGDILAALLAPLPDDIPTNAIIQEMIISHCMGITAVQCERLKGLVERLNVYV
jgi:hypothetical protein